MTDQPVLDLRAVGKAYRIYDQPADRLKQMLWGRWVGGYGTDFWALHPLDLQIHRGEAVGIIGRNGSGKSTLLQVISGIITPTCGTVHTRGRIAALLELGSGFNPEYSGVDNIYLNASVLGLTRAEIGASFDQIVAFADIGEFIHRPVKTYSSGMFVRLAFAIAMHVDPDILIVDEALAVGDIAFVGKCLIAVDAFRRRGGTLIVVSHDMGMIKNLTQRAVFLERGHLSCVGDAVAVADAYLQSLGETADSAAVSAFRDEHASAAISSVDIADPRTATRPDRQLTITSDGALQLRCFLDVIVAANVDFSLSVYDSTRRIVVAERIQLHLKPDSDAMVLVTIDHVLLVPGNYSINVSLCEHGTQAYMSWIRDACTLTLSGTEPITRVYRQPMRIRLEPSS